MEINPKYQKETCNCDYEDLNWHEKDDYPKLERELLFGGDSYSYGSCPVCGRVEVFYDDNYVNCIEYSYGNEVNCENNKIRYYSQDPEKYFNDKKEYFEYCEEIRRYIEDGKY